MSHIKACVRCAEPLEENVNFCPICGRPVQFASDEASDSVEEQLTLPNPGPLAKVSGLVLGLFLVAVVVITYVAGVASVALALGAPLLHGMIVATVLAVVAGGIFLYLRVK
jgi:hypothetical protein